MAGCSDEFRSVLGMNLQHQTSDLTGIRHIIVRAAFVAAVFCVNSLVVIGASNHTGGFAALWSANASLVFMLMVFPRKEHLFYCTSVLLASTAVNLVSGFPLQTSIIFSASNVLEAILAFHIISKLGLPKTGLYNPIQLVKFVGIALFVSSVSATTASLGSTGEVGNNWISWFGSDLLGLLIFLPCFNILHATLTGIEKYTWPKNRRLEFIGVLLLVFVVSAMALVQAVIPLLFLTAIPVFIAVFRFGPLGGMMSTLIVAIVAEFFTISGFGPIAGLDASNIIKIFVLQAYIASQLMLALPVASLLADSQRKVDKIIETEKLLRIMAEKDRQKAEAAKLQKVRLLALDELTGLSSRRHILEESEKAFELARSQNKLLSIAIFDVDKFKLVNDQFGHAVGDEILRMIGRVAKRYTGKNQLIGRMGGEEFLVVMPDTSIIEAEAQVETLRLAIMNARSSDPGVGVTISAGLAQNSECRDLKEMLLMADNALYVAKNGGRNRLEIAA
jgi:diguanylate cyclase (GGDEF)-like protein